MKHKTRKENIFYKYPITGNDSVKHAHIPSINLLIIMNQNERLFRLKSTQNELL